MESKNKMMTDALKWLDGADSQLRAFYSGNSRSTRYRKLAEREESAKDAALCHEITSFFAALFKFLRLLTPRILKITTRATSNISFPTH